MTVTAVVAPILGTTVDQTVAAVFAAFAVAVLCSAGMAYLGAKTRKIQLEFEMEEIEEDEAEKRAAFDRLKLWLLTPEGKAFLENSGCLPQNSSTKGGAKKHEEENDDEEDFVFDLSSINEDIPGTSEDGVPSATMSMFQEFGTPGAASKGGSL